MERLVLAAVGDFLALDHQKLFVGAVQRVEAVDAGQEVVIGQHEELVAVLAVPAHDIVRRGVAVAVERVRVRVALVPLQQGRRLSGRPATIADRCDETSQEEEAQHRRSGPERDTSHISLGDAGASPILRPITAEPM